MRLSLEQGGVVLCAESAWESQFLAGVEPKRKLAYRVGTGGAWRIDCVERTFSVDYASKQIFLPAGLSREAYCYALRVIADGLALDCGYLPFHAAGVSCDRLQALLFAKPGEGKSYFSHYVCSRLDGLRLIGDDHLILSDGMVRGNQVCRLRGREGRDCFAVAGQACSHGTNRIGFLLHPAPEPGSVMVVPTATAYRELCDASALKYLLDQPVFHGMEYRLDRVFGQDKAAQYERAIAHGAARLGALYLIRGPFPYIERILLQKMREQRIQVVL